MRFNSVLANKYRKNGFIMVLHDFKSSYYDVKLIHPTGKETWLECHRNKAVAIIEAKKRAMSMKVGFNQSTDVLI